MQTSFRSGIVRHQTDLNNNPIFLRKIGANVSIIVSPDPTIITFIDGSTDYLYTEYRTITNAWNTAVDGAYLYWDLSRVTGLISYQSTMLDPVIQFEAPSNPLTGQLWFDTINKYWFRFQGGWQRALVVFATFVDGVALTSMSDQAPVFRGTQVGTNTRQSVGSLVYDLAGQAIQNSLGQFFTTEDDFVAGVPFGSSMRIEALATYAIANNNLARFSVVRFIDFNQIVQADSSSQLNNTIGIVEEDIVVAPPSEGEDPEGARVRVIYAGPVTSEDWDWSGVGVDAPIYVSNTGEITASGVLGQLPIARVIDKQTILFEPWLGTQVAAGQAGVTDHGLLSGLGDDDHNQYHNNARGDARYLQISTAELNDLNDVTVANGSPINDYVLTYDMTSGLWGAEVPAAGGVTDHGALTGLGDNDHPQYQLVVDAVGSLADLSDVATGGSPSVDNFVLTYNNASGLWGPEAAAGGVLSRINDTQDDTFIETDTAGNGTANLIRFSINSQIMELQDVGTNRNRFTFPDSTTAAQAGSFEVYAGNNTSTGGGGHIFLYTGYADYGGSKSGDIWIATGNSNGNTGSGNIDITVGDAQNPTDNNANGGTITISAGLATDGNGGSVNLEAGYGNRGSGVGGAGGNVSITAGLSKGGATTPGIVTIKSGSNNETGGVGGSIFLTPSGGGTSRGADSLGAVCIRAGDQADTSQTVELRFHEGTFPADQYVGFKAPADLTANQIWTLPAVDGNADDVMTTDGNGVLSFAAASGGSPIVSTLNDLTDVTVANGAGIDNYVLTYDDGSGLWGAEASAGGGGGATPYDIIAQSIGVPTDGDVLTRMVFSRAVTIGNGSPVAHQGYAAIPPSGGTGTISVYKASPPFGGSPSGSLIGTLVFNDGSTSLDSETIAGTSFAVGDLVWFEMTSGNSMGDLTVTLDATAD